MVSRELLDPADLFRAQVLCIHKTTEVIVVRKNEDLMFAAFQEVALSLEYFNNG